MSESENGIAADLARGVSRYLMDAGFSVLTELPLRNWRRVDVIGIDRRNRVCIVEIKSGPQDFLSDRKWHEYLDYCDLFYFAVAAGFPREILPPEPGLILADRYGGAVIRDAPENRIAAHVRKEVTLRFARKAADRLNIDLRERER
ncbi:MAG: MmcB family DNA repair protein [Alphaproteobacteria bacterium]|nr:MmcB family DNA repair protein [Alphaproteobacteria bacterium]